MTVELIYRGTVLNDWNKACFKKYNVNGVKSSSLVESVHFVRGSHLINSKEIDNDTTTVIIFPSKHLATFNSTMQVNEKTINVCNDLQSLYTFHCGADLSTQTSYKHSHKGQTHVLLLTTNHAKFDREEL